MLDDLGAWQDKVSEASAGITQGIIAGATNSVLIDTSWMGARQALSPPPSSNPPVATSTDDSSLPVSLESAVSNPDAESSDSVLELNVYDSSVSSAVQETSDFLSQNVNDVSTYLELISESSELANNASSETLSKLDDNLLLAIEYLDLITTQAGGVLSTVQDLSDDSVAIKEENKEIATSKASKTELATLSTNTSVTPSFGNTVAASNTTSSSGSPFSGISSFLQRSNTIFDFFSNPGGVLSSAFDKVLSFGSKILSKDSGLPKLGSSNAPVVASNYYNTSLVKPVQSFDDFVNKPDNTTLGKRLSSWFNRLFSVPTLGTNVGMAAYGIGSGLGNFANGALTGTGNMLGNTAYGIGSGIGAIGQGFGAGIGAIGQGFGAGIGAIGQGFGSATSGLGNLFTGISSVVEAVLSPINSLFGIFGKKEGKKDDKLLNDTLREIHKLLIAPEGTPFFEELNDVCGSGPAGSGNLSIGIGATGNTLLIAGLVAMVIPFLDRIISSIGDILLGTLEILEKPVTMILGVVSRLVNWLIDDVWPQVLKPLFTDILLPLLREIRQPLTDFMTVTLDTLSTVLSFVKDIVVAIKDPVISVIGELAEFIAAVVHQIILFFTDPVQFFTGVFDELGKLLLTLIPGAGKVKEWWENRQQEKNIAIEERRAALVAAGVTDEKVLAKASKSDSAFNRQMEKIESSQPRLDVPTSGVQNNSEASTSNSTVTNTTNNTNIEVRNEVPAPTSDFGK